VVLLDALQALAMPSVVDKALDHTTGREGHDDAEELHDSRI
jgi:hypothetical protein